MNQPFISHVQELKRRLMWAVLMVGVVSLAAYTQREPILAWLEAPLQQTLYYSRVTGAFEFIVKACLLTGVLAAAPLIIYQLIAFVGPALPRPLPRRSVAGLIVMASVLVASGVLFGYYISLPAALNFLGGIDTAHLHPLLAADSYLTFVMGYLAVFGLVFLLPLVMAFVDRIKPLPPAKLRRVRKWVIIGAFASALVLPVAPDPVSQALLALPVIAMYEVSIWLIWLQHYQRRRATRPAEAPTVIEAEAVESPAAEESPLIEIPPPRYSHAPDASRRAVEALRPARPALAGRVIDLRGR